MNYKELMEDPLDKKPEMHYAIDYVCRKLSIPDPLQLKCIIKVTDDINADIARIHFRPEEGNDDPNGTTIPVIFQSEEYKNSVAGTDDAGKTVILINHKKLRKVLSVFFTSVVVHELSHCADYVFKLPLFKEKYDIEIENVTSGTVADCLGGYYTFHSEARAKYLQEMFTIDRHDPSRYRDIFYKNDGEVKIDPIVGESDFYHASHCAGKIRCWEEIFVYHPIDPYCDEEKRIVDSIKKRYLKKHQYRDIINNMYDVWDWDIMIQKCDKILKDYGGNLNVEIREDDGTQ